MIIVDLASESESAREQAANFLVEHFDEPLGRPDLDSAREEVVRVLREGFARAMLDSQTLVGWVGGLPEYQGRVWELHPIVVHLNFRGEESDGR
jgi:aminoglycoside 6'-N-acetyltransferase I